MKQGTICVQGAYRPKNGEPRVLPIVQSTTYKYDSSVEMGDLFDLKKSGYFYSRLQNPTNDTVAAKITMLEGGVAGMLTSSGQAANFYAVFNIAQAGDHIVSSSAIYGGTYNLFNVTMRKLGIDFTFVSPDATEEEIQAAFKPNTKAVFGETISNPSLDILDIEFFEAVAERKEDSELIKFKELPEVPVALCVNHYGAYEHMPETFAELFAYAEANGYEVIDRPRFCHIDGIWNKETVDEWMTEIQLPIKLS